jgi:outer membrane protein OmpA-like peptidoglycan-associated protein
MLDHKERAKQIVQVAREATQTAEDARAIAEQREHQEQLAKVQADEARAREAQTRLEAEAAQLRAQSNSARAEADANRASAERAEAEASAAKLRAAQAEARARQAEVAAQSAPPVVIQSTPPTSPPQQQPDPKILLRTRLLTELTLVGNALDTARGLVITIPDNGFAGATARETSMRELARISQIVVAQPALRVQVEGHCDNSDGEAVALRRAQLVRDALVAYGLPASRASVRGWGDSRPVESNATAIGREHNRRVEIVISGEPIGDRPVWDRTYPLLRSGE